MVGGWVLKWILVLSFRARFGLKTEAGLCWTIPEDNATMKKTFRSIENRTFKDNILKFKQMSKGIECCIRSGFCTSHNCKVVRKVTEKKMSSIGGDGRLQWKMCEVTILACPSWQIPGQPRAASKQVKSVIPKSGWTNRKEENLMRDVWTNHPRTK